MASINKLSIRGVRSFSPDDDEQVIEFLYPITIVVGANGCGKTTIIESLKYAVTGSLPPGKNPGQSFVHDPKSVGQSVVKANVKLRFTNRAGSSMVLVRAMELTQRKTTLSFKALDGVLRTSDPNTGERISMSHKCTELDRQIPVLLGVSKPILEHVVFCHQEESSWPLMDSAVLKKRFDDIFDSTQYAKALKNIAEIKKEYQGKVKDLKADLNGLASHKHAAKGFRQELNQQNAQLEDLEEEMDVYSKEIKEAEKTIQEMSAIISKKEDVKAEIEERQADLEKENSVLAKQRSMLEEDMTERHTQRELKDMLRDFDEEVGHLGDKQADLERDRESLKKDLDSLNKEEIALTGQIGRLQAEQSAHDDMLKQRLAMMEDVSQKYGINLHVSQSQDTSAVGAATQASTTIGVGDCSQESIVSLSEDDLNAFRKALAAKERELIASLKEHKAQAELQEDQLSGALSDLVAKQKALDNERKKNADEQQDARRELQTLNSRNAGHSRIRQSDIDEAKKTAARFAKRRDEAAADGRKGEISVEIRSLEEKIDKLKREIDDDSQLVKDLRLNADAQNEISVLKDQTTKDLERLQEGIQEYSFDFQKYGFQVPNQLPGYDGDDEKGEGLILEMESHATTVQDKHDEVHQKHTKCTQEVSSLRQSVAEKSALLAHNRETLNTLRSKVDAMAGEDGSAGKFQRIVGAIREFETGANMNCTVDESDPQNVVSYINSRIEAIDESSAEETTPEAVTSVVKRLKTLVIVQDETTGRPRAKCPCCQRYMDKSETQTFSESIKQLLRDGSPLMKIDRESMERSRAAKASYQRWRRGISECANDLMEQKRLASEITTLEGTISGLEDSIASQRGQLDGLSNESTDLLSESNELRNLAEVSKRWVEDAKRIGSKRMRISEKSLDLTMSMTGVSSGSRDLRVVERELEEKREQKDGLLSKMAKLNKELTNLNQMLTQLTQQANSTEQIAREREAKFAKEKEATNRKTALNDQIKTCAELEKKLQDQLMGLRPRIRSKEADKQKHREYSKSEEERLSGFVSKFKSDTSGLENITIQIDKHSKSRETHNLQVLEGKITKAKGRAQEKVSRLESIEPELERVLRTISDQGRHRKLIQENIGLYQARQRITDLEKEIKGYQEDLENIEGHDVCETYYERATSRKKGAEGKRARLEGRRGGFVDQIRGLKRKLLTPEYKGIDERHREMMIRHDTTQIAVTDLDKYYNALDKALLRYHGIKIEEINKIIRELWTLTYKGEDITNIELVSGQDTGSRASRSYNYRVVMSKGSTQLDMRGRCSAGQRVLASIVIRLALAETFCVNFGCIALDEPTVNLDYNNKRGLATALAQIIASRSQQSNFQLLVITHDEEFVSMMKGELAGQTGFSMPDKYFQVRREEGVDGKYYSKINAIDWDELS